MRFIVPFFWVVVVFAAGAQPLDVSSAPSSFLGYAFGAEEEALVAGLEKTEAVVQRDRSRAAQGLTRATVANQTLDKLDKVTLEFGFSKGSLFQVTASLAPSPEALKSLTGVLNEKYGKVRSLDGGYHYNWFFYAQVPPAANQVPDFAIVLTHDPVTRKVLSLTYTDNLRKAAGPVPPTGQASPGAATGGTPVPALDPSRF